jgi:hypothetical protein
MNETDSLTKQSKLIYIANILRNPYIIKTIFAQNISNVTGPVILLVKISLT